MVYDLVLTMASDSATSKTKLHALDTVLSKSKIFKYKMAENHEQ